jgi:hypothetical protein
MRKAGWFFTPEFISYVMFGGAKFPKVAWFMSCC